jgi:hypothetical protein
MQLSNGADWLQPQYERFLLAILVFAEVLLIIIIKYY